MRHSENFNVAELSIEEIIRLLAILQPHGPLQPLLFAELQRRRGGPILPSFTPSLQTAASNPKRTGKN